MEPLQLTIKRLWPKDKYTIGRLYINGEHYCNTLHPRGLEPEGGVSQQLVEGAQAAHAKDKHGYAAGEGS